MKKAHLIIAGVAALSLTLYTQLALAGTILQDAGTLKPNPVSTFTLIGHGHGGHGHGGHGHGGGHGGHGHWHGGHGHWHGHHGGWHRGWHGHRHWGWRGGWGGSCYWNCIRAGFGPGYCHAFSWKFCY